MASTILLVVVFRSSSHLATAYGVAITSTMIVTTTLLFVVAPMRLGWNPVRSTLVLSAFLAVEIAFFGANLLKFIHGAWVPLIVGAAVFVLMTTWMSGRRILAGRLENWTEPLDGFFESLRTRSVTRVPGTAVYMTGDVGRAPTALLRNLEHFGVLHERVLLVTLTTERVPHVTSMRRVEFEELELGFHRAVGRFGFMDRPDVLKVLSELRNRGWTYDLGTTTFFVGRERLLAQEAHRLPRWRASLFAFLARNEQRATAYFNIPPDRVVEVGTQIRA